MKTLTFATALLCAALSLPASSHAGDLVFGHWNIYREDLPSDVALRAQRMFGVAPAYVTVILDCHKTPSYGLLAEAKASSDGYGFIKRKFEENAPKLVGFYEVATRVAVDGGSANVEKISAFDNTTSLLSNSSYQSSDPLTKLDWLLGHEKVEIWIPFEETDTKVVFDLTDFRLKNFLTDCRKRYTG